MANDHGEDCGPAGLQMSLSAADTAHYPIVGIGSDAAQAFAPYRVTVDGQRIAVITATQILPPGLQTQWTATSSQPGVASAVGQGGQGELIAAVQAARRTSDTVVVYLYWGTETQACPNPQQKPLAEALVKAGADIVVGSGTHVQSGAGYLGRAFVDYGLGNLAFYDTKSPETSSGSLVVTVTGRHVDKTTWRPALISDGLPQPLTGASAASAVQQWDGLRGCTGLTAAAGKATATVHAETAAPTTTTTTIKSTTTTTHRG
jgi:poly-gamma-glutamate synthesis protein (capsule biosynthesis protein)